ncbi:MAG TPA: hypothetical protein VG992_04360 [Candidatus Saccharimonadales bacterium]|nr:hypothetical protein [Candidatus Saccharimonadales bacterium]
MKRDYVAVMFEHINNNVKVVMEAVGMMQDKMETLATKDSVDALTMRVSTLEVAVRETNKDLHKLDTHVGRLHTRIGQLDRRVGQLDTRVSRIEDKLFITA